MKYDFHKKLSMKYDLLIKYEGWLGPKIKYEV